MRGKNKARYQRRIEAKGKLLEALRELIMGFSKEKAREYQKQWRIMRGRR